MEYVMQSLLYKYGLQSIWDLIIFYCDGIFTYLL